MRNFKSKVMNNHGFSMVEIMVAAGLLGGLALGVAQIAKNMGFVQSVSTSRADELELRNEIKTILENPDHCGVSMIPLAPFKKMNVDQYSAGEGLPIVLSTKTPSGNIKRYEGSPTTAPLTDFNHFGKIRITSMKLLMDQSGTGSNYAPNQTFHSDLGRLVVETERPDGAGSKNKRLDFQVIVGMSTNGSSMTSIVNCKSKNEADPCDALNLELDGATGDCKPKTTTTAGIMAPSGAGGWGNWGGWTNCPANTLACGVKTKVEHSQGGGDDTAMNAVRLECCVNTSGMGRINNTEIGSAESGWGDWGDPHFCPAAKNNYIKGYRLKIEGSQGGGDDTALNAVEMKCADGTLVTSASMGWGNWRPYQECPAGQFVCGLRSKIEGGQGGGDDTAMNNLQLRCCNVPP